MKKENTITGKTINYFMMGVVIVSMSACAGGEKKKVENQQAESEAKAEVKAPKTDIFTAAFLGDVETIKQHIAYGSDLDEKEPTMGSTALISASTFGKTEIVRALLEGGADPNIQNNEGSTALHSAAFLCYPEIVKLLLENGVDKSILNIYGSTALISVAGPFNEVKPIYDEFAKGLGPLGLKLDYEQLEKTRPIIAEMLR